MAFDDSLHDLTDYEREKGLTISDVIKVVRLPPSLPPMREVMRLQCRTIVTPLSDLDNTITNAASKLLSKLSMNKEVSKIVYPFIKITRAIKDTVVRAQAAKKRSKPDDSMITPVSGSLSPALALSSSMLLPDPAMSLSLLSGAMSMNHTDSPKVPTIKTSPALPSDNKPNRRSSGDNKSTNETGLSVVVQEAVRKQHNDMNAVEDNGKMERLQQIEAFSGVKIEKGKRPKKSKGRRMSFSGSVVHSAELAETLMKKGGSITSNLPAAESLVISLAAAERTIVGLERDNDRHLRSIISITEKQVADRAEADKLKLLVAKLELGLANSKKDLINVKYKGHLEDKQLEQRIREASQLKSKLHELKSRTEPLIANLTSKVAYLESMTETEQDEKHQIHEAQVLMENERAAERERLLREECLQVIEDTRINYQSVLDVLCAALEKLGMEVVGEAVSRQEDASRNVQRALQEITDIATSSAGQQLPQHHKQQQEQQQHRQQLPVVYSDDPLSLPLEPGPRASTATESRQRKLSYMSDIDDDEDGSVMSIMAEPGVGILTREVSIATPIGLIAPPLQPPSLPISLEEFQSNFSSKKELQTKIRSNSHSQVRPVSHTPLPPDYQTNSNPSLPLPLIDPYNSYPPMFLDCSQEAIFPSLPSQQAERELSLKAWVDCEGLQTAVRMQLDSIRVSLSNSSGFLVNVPALHSCLKVPEYIKQSSFTDSNSVLSISVGSTPRSARSTRFADENGGSVEIGPRGSEPNSPGKAGAEMRQASKDRGISFSQGGSTPSTPGKARQERGKGISFSQLGSAPSSPGKENGEGRKARQERESEVSSSQNSPGGKGVVVNFDEYVTEWVSRITDLHHAVNTQEGERYMTALRLGEREARLVLRRLKASEYREDKAHRELKRLSQLEATLILNSADRGGVTRSGGGLNGVGFAESPQHSIDGLGLESPSSRLGPMGPVLVGGSSLFESKSLSSTSLYEQSQGEWGLDHGSQMIDGITQKGKEDGRSTLKMISQLRDDLQQIRLLSYEPVLIRLKQLGTEVKDLKGMESSLRLYSMAIKKQIVTLQNNLSVSLGISSPRGDVNDNSNVGYMSELDRRAVKHRMACLQSQLDGIDKRVISIREEEESLRMTAVQELFTYESCLDENTFPGLSRTLCDMRVWASNTSATSSGGKLIRGPMASSSSSLPLSPTTRSRSRGRGSGNTKLLDPLSSSSSRTLTTPARFPVPIPVERASTRAGLLLSALASQSMTSQSTVLKEKTDAHKRGRATTARSHLNIDWSSESSDSRDRRNGKGLFRGANPYRIDQGQSQFSSPEGSLSQLDSCSLHDGGQGQEGSKWNLFNGGQGFDSRKNRGKGRS